MAPKKQAEADQDAAFMVVGAIRAAAVVISSAIFYTQRISVSPPFDAKEQPFNAGELFDQTFQEFLD